MYDWTSYMNAQYPNWQPAANTLGAGGDDKLGSGQGNPWTRRIAENQQAWQDRMEAWKQQIANRPASTRHSAPPPVGTTYTDPENKGPFSWTGRGAGLTQNPYSNYGSGYGDWFGGFIQTPENMASEWYGSYLPSGITNPVTPRMGVEEWLGSMKSAYPQLYQNLMNYYGMNQPSSPVPATSPVYGPGGENPAYRNALTNPGGLYGQGMRYGGPVYK